MALRTLQQQHAVSVHGKVRGQDPSISGGLHEPWGSPLVLRVVACMRLPLLHPRYLLPVPLLPILPVLMAAFHALCLPDG